MALQITKTENGIRIGEDFIYAPQTIISGIINLQTHIGSEMAYDRGNILSIDFPGEYDIGGVIINTFLGNGDKLNHLIINGEEKFWIIQSPEVLESDEVSGMDYWLFEDDTVSKKLDQLEMEGEKVDLRQIIVA